MNNSYPYKQKQQAIKKVLQLGRGKKEVAEEHDISLSTLYRWLKEEEQLNKESKSRFIRKKIEVDAQKISDERKVLIKAIIILAKELAR